jgi:GDP-4-dehydro-6-deoxy-D-mannose reductase
MQIEVGARRVSVERLDVTDYAETAAAVYHARPNLIFHFAATTGGRQTRGQWGAVQSTNVLGTVNILEASLLLHPRPRVIVPGSSAQFGKCRPEDVPLEEASPYRPLTDYAVSKIAQSAVAARYAVDHQLDVVRTHTFNCIGPGLDEAFAPSFFCKQIAEAEAGLREPILEVGTTTTTRDFVDIRDVVRAYWSLAQDGRKGEIYNVCSGVGTRIGALMDALLEWSNVGIEVRSGSGREVRVDVPYQIGSYQKLREHTRWNPEFPWQESLRGLLDQWREKSSHRVGTQNR